MREQIYTPGAGHTPPMLAGRQDRIDAWQVTLNDLVRRGRKGGQDALIQGVRGVGKSVLLTRFREIAADRGYAVVALTGGSDELHQLGLRIRNSIEMQVREDRPWWGRALERFDRVSVNVLGIGAQVHTKDRAPAGTDTEALAKLLSDFAHDMKESTGGGVIITIDEIQTVLPRDVRSLGYVLNHLSSNHQTAPVMLVGAGLPDTIDRLVGPKRSDPLITNPERLFHVMNLEPQLSPEAASAALVVPARDHGAFWDPDAAQAVQELSGRYPAHLQSFAAYAWQQGERGDPVTFEHVRASAPAALADIEREFLAPRWNRLTDKQAEYLTAVAVCGGRAETGQVADVLGKDRTGLSQRREALIARGELFAPTWGSVQLAFPAMRQYALAKYPALEASRPAGALVRPSEMEKNLAAWKHGEPKTRQQEAFKAATSEADELTNRVKALGGDNDPNDPDQLPQIGMTNLHPRGPSLG